VVGDWGLPATPPLTNHHSPTTKDLMSKTGRLDFTHHIYSLKLHTGMIRLVELIYIKIDFEITHQPGSIINKIVTRIL